MVINYHWVNTKLTLEYTALIGNGHTGSIVSDTKEESTDGLLYEKLDAAAMKGKVLPLTATVARNSAGGPAPVVHVAIWQSDPKGKIPGRFNEQEFDAGGVFDDQGIAKVDITITFA
jgi:protocatechuate 3,4-dioxygenase beta subunit